LAAVSAGEMGCGSNRAQPAHNNTNETVGSQYFKMSNCHHMLRQQYCDRSLLSSPRSNSNVARFMVKKEIASEHIGGFVILALFVAKDHSDAYSPARPWKSTSV